MEYQKTDIEGVYLLKPKVFGDARGYFVETWKQADFDEHVGKVTFIQDNESKSSRGVLRGLHYQKAEWSQAKLVRVIKGRVLDVAVDIRKSSPTFGKHVMAELSDENKHQLFIPRGFAHGFLVLSDEAIAEKMGISEFTVLRVLQRNGYVPKRKYILVEDDAPFSMPPTPVTP